MAGTSPAVSAEIVTLARRTVDIKTQTLGRVFLRSGQEVAPIRSQARGGLGESLTPWSTTSAAGTDTGGVFSGDIRN
jgi:hypothetical protein